MCLSNSSFVWFDICKFLISVTTKKNQFVIANLFYSIVFALLYLLLCFDTIEERSYAIGSFVVADCVKNGGGEIRDRFNHSIGVILSDTVSVFFLSISLHSLLDQITVNGRTQSLTWSLTVCCRRQSQCSFLHYNLNHQFRIFIIY